MKSENTTERYDTAAGGASEFAAVITRSASSAVAALGRYQSE
jgi:hypothetical protein